MLKLLLEFGPLAAFFLAYKFGNLMLATAVLIAATLLTLLITWLREKKLALTPLITGIVVTVFGGLTLYLDSELFIKMKPTIVNGIFAAILLAGVALGRGLLKPLMGMAMELTDRGWLVLSRNYGLFFIGLAILNECIWRNFSTDFWVNFKVFGMLTITTAFSIWQILAIKKHMVETEDRPLE